MDFKSFQKKKKKPKWDVLYYQSNGYFELNKKFMKKDEKKEYGHVKYYYRMLSKKLKRKQIRRKMV